MVTAKRTRVIVVATAVISLSLLYFFIDARGTKFFPKCPFHALTGFYCPGCGSQRAISALLHLDFESAIHMNVLLVSALPLIFYSATIAVINAFARNPVQQKLVYSVLFIRVTGIIIVLFWVLRNIPCYPFDLLAPLSN